MGVLYKPSPVVWWQNASSESTIAYHCTWAATELAMTCVVDRCLENDQPHPASRRHGYAVVSNSASPRLCHTWPRHDVIRHLSYLYRSPGFSPLPQQKSPSCSAPEGGGVCLFSGRDASFRDTALHQIVGRAAREHSTRTKFHQNRENGFRLPRMRNWCDYFIAFTFTLSCSSLCNIEIFTFYQIK